MRVTQDMVEAEGLATRASNLEKQKASAQRQVAAEHERLAQQRSVAAEAVGAAEAAEQELHHQQTHNQCAPAAPGGRIDPLRLHLTTWHVVLKAHANHVTESSAPYWCACDYGWRGAWLRCGHADGIEQTAIMRSCWQQQSKKRILACRDGTQCFQRRGHQHLTERRLIVGDNAGDAWRSWTG
jgi:hypothetical protein